MIACSTTIEAQWRTIANHDLIIEGDKKNFSNQAEIIVKLQASVAQPSADKSAVEVEKTAVREDYLGHQNAFERKMEKFGATFLNFYVNSLLHQGSLGYLVPKFACTLALVWEEILSRFSDSDDVYTE